MDIEQKQLIKERDDVEFVLSTKQGRGFLWRVLALCGVYQDIHSDNPEEMSRKLGQRSIGLLLMQIIGDVDQDKLFLMMKEAKDHQEDIDALIKKLENKEDENNANDFI